MDKKAIDINPSVVGRFATGGVLAGAGGAAALSLVRMIRDMKSEQEEQRKEPETDENTIVLTLPRKQAEVTSSKCSKILTKESTKRTVAKGYGTQHRRPSGTFGPSTATKTATGWPSLSAGVLAGIAGTAVGAHVVGRVYQKHREQELGKDLDAARQEYLDALSGTGKTAAAYDSFFGFTAMPDKEANVTGMLNWPLAAAAIMSVLGAGGTGYVTKRLLDEKFQERSTKGLNLPKVNRIMFRSAPTPAADVPISPDEDEQMEATAEDVQCVKAAVCVMVDLLDPEPKILGTPYVKQACADAGVTADELLKSAQDVDALMSHLQGNPQLQTMLTRAGMENHPVMKHFRWATKIPGIRGMINNKAMSRLQQMLASPKPQASAVQPSPARPEITAPPIAPKSASTGALLTSILGSSIAGNAAQSDAPAPVPEADPETNAARAGGIAIESGDPAAGQYVTDNKARIKALVEQLVQQGKM